MNKTRPLPSRYRKTSRGDGVIVGLFAFAIVALYFLFYMAFLATAVWVVVWVLQQMGVL